MVETKETLALGFIGGSMQSAIGYTHKIACEMDGYWKLQAGCFSHIEESNRLTAQSWNIPAHNTYSNYQELLASEKGALDAIVVLTPTPMHAEVVIAALDAGYAVICEKAMACSVDEAEQIKKAVTRNNGFLAVTFNYSGYPMLRELRRLIASGTLGKIHQIQIEMPQEGFIRLNQDGQKPQPQTWRLHDNNIPTISLDLGVHLHHIVNFLTEEIPLQVVADYASFGWYANVTDNVMCMARYSNNIRCAMWYSKTAIGDRNGLRIRLYGDKASAEWFQMQPEDLLVNYPDGRQRIVDRADNETGIASLARYNRFKAGHPAGFLEAFANLYCDIAECLHQYKRTQTFKSDTVFGADHALEGLKLFEAISLSSSGNCWIQL